jgi:C4-dicarboxylate transporter, DctM subunit
MVVLTAASFLILLALGVPVAFVIGVSGFIGLWWSGQYPLTVIVKQTFEGVDSFVLLAIPLFILAGALMETGGIAVRLVRLAQVLVGWIRGGLSMAVVVAEYIFSGISGSTVADVSAIGSTMIPPMLKAGYSKEQAVAVVSAASAMGILVPPCILMIVIASVANVSVAALFAAGFLPAVVIALAIMVYIWLDARRSGIEARAHVTWAAVRHAFLDAVIPLGLPAIIFGGILGGAVTPTEAAVLAVVYAFIVGLVVYREIKWRDLPGLLIQSAVVTAAVCFLLGTAAVVAWVLAIQQIPQLLLNAMLTVPGGNVVFLAHVGAVHPSRGRPGRASRRGHPAPHLHAGGDAARHRPRALQHGGGGGHRHRPLPAPHRRGLLHRLRHRQGAGRSRERRDAALRLDDVHRPARGHPLSLVHSRRPENPEARVICEGRGLSGAPAVKFRGPVRGARAGARVRKDSFAIRQSRLGIRSRPARNSMVEPAKSSPTGSQRPPRWVARKASTTAVKERRFATRPKPCPSSA